MALLAGTRRPLDQPWEPFHPLAMDFLAALSAAVRQGCARREELAAFGFWCRRSRLEQLAQERPEDCRLVKTCHDGQAVEYYIPKSWIKIRPPRVASEAQKAAAMAALQKAKNKA